MSGERMNVVERDGKWWVGNQGPFDTNAEAWRWLDRKSGETISKAEDTAEWIASKDAP